MMEGLLEDFLVKKYGFERELFPDLVTYVFLQPILRDSYRIAGRIVAERRWQELPGAALEVAQITAPIGS